MPGTKLKCTSPECDYETPNAPEFGQALSLLQMHQANSHVSAIGNVNTSHVEQRSRILEPKELDLDPSECNEAGYLFWKSKFEDYLEETGTNDDGIKFKRLKAKLELKCLSKPLLSLTRCKYRCKSSLNHWMSPHSPPSIYKHLAAMMMSHQ